MTVDDATCATCPFFHGGGWNILTGREGSCRRRAPGRSGWPVVGEHDGCGEHPEMIALYPPVPAPPRRPRASRNVP